MKMAPMGAGPHLPSVDRLARSLPDLPLPHALMVRLARQVIDAARVSGTPVAIDALVEQLREVAEPMARSRLTPVINATGIVLHTNLGRAPLSEKAVRAIAAAAANYNNLEMDLASGTRGKRGAYLEALLATLCDAEAATVVNNCAAALVLILHHFTRGERTEVLISRGELVQIGGGFRVPEILEAAGATLREVGTTNRTELQDYRAAISPKTALVLKVHRSNFHMEGFVASPDTGELAELAHEHGLPFVEDLGSGAMPLTASVGASAREPTAAELLRAGADLVCFSGDKLFGGPQAGIIVGGADRVRGLKSDPLFRALRCDKLIFAALEATAESHLARAPEEILSIHLLTAPLESLHARTGVLARQLAERQVPADVIETTSEIGGGSLPQTEIPAVALRLRAASGRNLEQMAERLRRPSPPRPPVIAYISQNALLFNLRTVLPHQDTLLVDAIHQAFTAKDPHA